MLEGKKRSMVDALKLPQDAALGEMLVTLIGRRQVHIENYRSILFYTDQEVQVQGKGCRLCVGGNRLCIEYYTTETMKIAGVIKTVEFTA